MKSWKEIENQKYVYLAEECQTTDEDENGIIIPQFQKCEVQYVERNEVLVIVVDGKYKGEELYYYTDRENPEELLTEDELKLLNTSEIKIWKELNKTAKLIDSLKETPSDNLKNIRRIIMDEMSNSR